MPREDVAKLVAESWATQLSDGIEASEQFSRMVAAADEVTELALQVGYHLGRSQALADGLESPADLEEWVEALRLLNLMLDAARDEAG